jgi:membrane fusion protein, multidrug efflux system
MSKTPNRAIRRLFIWGAIIALIAAGGAYWGYSPNVGQKAAAATPAPAVAVTVKTLAQEKVRVWSEFSGRLHAVDSAEIRPEVGGRITEVRFEDGQNVKAGDILFVIDPRPYDAAVQRAKAGVATAQANANLAKLELDRAAGLLKAQAIAQTTYDGRANENRVAIAAIDSADAILKQAEIDLDHAYVKAPISGRASHAEITLGNLVQPGSNAPLLTTIVSNDTIYADFEVDELTYIESVRSYAKGRDDERRIPVQLSVLGDTAHVYRGTIYSFDNRIDPASGTIRARAKFDNADGSLVPGMFVSVKLAEGAERVALMVPDRAVGFDQSRKFVYVVDEQNKVSYRPIELGKPVGSERIALSGVEAGDRVIVDGVQHVRPDAVVDPKEGAPSSPPQAASLPASTSN